MHPLDCSDDFTYALLFISPKMLDDLQFNIFSHDIEKFNYAPICSLTDEQAAHLLNIVEYSRGDRHLGYSSRHTQVPVPVTKPKKALA